MKDLIQNARAVEARLRELEYEMQEEAADIIDSLCTALEAAQSDKEELGHMLLNLRDASNATLEAAQEDKPFQPDWATYRQGRTDGKAEALEAAQPTFAIDGMTPSQFAMRELYEFQEATGCDTAAQAKGKLEAAQKDAERYRWLKNRIEVRKQAAVNGSVRDSISVRIGYAFIDATTRTFPKEYEVEISAKLDQAVDAAIKAQGDVNETA